MLEPFDQHPSWQEGSARMGDEFGLFRTSDTADAQSHSGINRLSRRPLHATQDVIVVVLIIVLFALMARTLWRMVKQVFEPDMDFRIVISEVLFVLVMVELVRLLQVFLWDHYVAVDSMVEVGIISTLREVVLHGVVDLDWQHIVAIALFLLALGALLRFGDLRFRFTGMSIGARSAEDGRDQKVRAVRQPTSVE
jgi:uncharacterized membrane protein (DUF373 family)